MTSGRFETTLTAPTPTLPFVLGVVPTTEQDVRIETILMRIESLQTLAAESRRELDALRELSAEILEAVKARPSAMPEPAVLPTEAPSENVEVKAAPLLRLRLLGSFDAHLRGQSIGRWPSRKARLLLAYLALERGRLVPKDVLIDLFWPDAPLERGSNNLSIAIHQLRTAMTAVEPESGQAIVVRQGLYGLLTDDVSTDLWDFQAQLADARRALERKDDDATRTTLSIAVSLCEGDLLESDPYEDWAVEPRRSLGAAYNHALAWLATDAARANDWARVIDLAGRILQRDRCDESAHRWLMTGYWKLGNRPQALQQYRVYEDTLQRELGVQPSAESRRLHEQILAR